MAKGHAGRQLCLVFVGCNSAGRVILCWGQGVVRDHERSGSSVCCACGAAMLAMRLFAVVTKDHGCSARGSSVCSLCVLQRHWQRFWLLA